MIRGPRGYNSHRKKNGSLEHIPLTKSLDEALTDLPQHLETGYLWIEQICINQRDRGEQQKQVLLMKEIYTAAKRVLVWLGAVDEGVEPLLKFMRENDWEIESVFGSPVAIAGLLQFFDHPWFSRIWVVQESALAREIRIVKGAYLLDWMSNSNAFRLMLAKMLGRPNLSFAYAFHGTSVHLWKEVADDLGSTDAVEWSNGGYHWTSTFPTSHEKKEVEKTALQFCRLLWTVGRKLLAKDPRDKVLAYLGSWKPRTFTAEGVYDVTASVVYTRLVRSVIYEWKSLDLLACGNGVNPVHGKEFVNMPSWVPDWSGQTVTLFPVFDRFGVELCWDASRGRQHEPYLPGSELPGNLKTLGKPLFLLGSISSYTIPPTTGTSEHQVLLDFNSELVSHLRQDVNFQHLDFDLLLETICRASNCGEELGYNTSMIAEALHSTSRKHGRDYGRYSSWSMAVASLGGRSFMKTECGKIGIVPQQAVPGDLVTVLHGCRVPIVLRKIENTFKYQLVGDCYIDGIMFGEAVNWKEDEADRFVLV